MVQAARLEKQRTNVDVVFDHLYDEIASMRLRPGEKISEADIAAQFGISRQPVRDAFSRLENMDLLMIRPKRATKVKRFSLKEIEKSRFVRAAVEAKILAQAALEYSEDKSVRLDASLAEQRKVVDEGDHSAFSLLDYNFHKTLCEIAKADFAFEVVSAEKAKVDRLCILSLSHEDSMPELLHDHETIVDMIKRGDADGAIEAGMRHLSRLDETIKEVSASNLDYFEP